MSAITSFLSAAGVAIFHCQKCLPIMISITTEITKFTYNYIKQKKKEEKRRK